MKQIARRVRCLFKGHQWRVTAWFRDGNPRNSRDESKCTKCGKVIRRK